MRVIAALTLLLCLASCDVRYLVFCNVVDKETNLPIDTFTVYHINKMYPDTTMENGHTYINKGRFFAEKITGFLNPEPLHIKIYAQGYEMIDLDNLRGDGDTLLIELKRAK